MRLMQPPIAPLKISAQLRICLPESVDFHVALPELLLHGPIDIASLCVLVQTLELLLRELLLSVVEGLRHQVGRRSQHARRGSARRVSLVRRRSNRVALAGWVPTLG